MAVIARRPALALVLAVIGSALLHAAGDVDVRARLGQIATALTAKDPSDALSPFSKSMANYTKLRDDLIGLTNAYAIQSEVDVTGENDGADEITATLRWSMTLASGEATAQRSADIHLRMKREKNKWKIVEFAPIDMFDPSGPAPRPN